ncbi:unnamed protein product [Durusdinium trenchii]|uniref:Uncharacterized protein n=1 Tax=Durusdinium trenchii TaxID=1381693 RepID=A0ABP0N3F4_9DINO
MFDKKTLGMENPFAATFAEERSDLPLPLQKRLPLKQLSSMVDGTFTGKQMDMKLTPHAALGRAIRVYQHAIFAHEMREFSLEEVYSKSGYSNNGMTGSFNKHAVIKDMVTERLLDVQEIIEVLCEHVERIYKAPVAKIHELLSNQHAMMKDQTNFKNLLDSTYERLVVSQLGKGNEFLQDLVQHSTASVRVDLMQKHLDLAMLAGARPRKDSCWAQTVSCSCFKGIKQYLKVLQGLLDGEADTDDVQVAQRMPAMTNFVEGGGEDFPVEDYQRVDVDGLNKAADKYFTILKGQIAILVEQTLDDKVQSRWRCLKGD